MIVDVVDPELTRELRRSVLRPQLAPGAPLPGDERTDPVHFAVLDQGVAVSTCWVAPEPCPWRPTDQPGWQLRQMATTPEHRGQGLASLVVAAVLDYCIVQGGRIIWCNARERAVPMYGRCGFRTEGAIFTDAEHPIPHQRMWRPLANLSAGPARLPGVDCDGPR
jgi:GNAT superfamily N-acetyltransferase